MAIKIKQILDAQGTDTLLFSSWLTAQGINRAEQAAYVQSGWLEKVAHGVYKVAGANVSLFSAVSAYNSQLGKQCIIGAETALDIRGYSHYVPMGKPLAFLFTESRAKLPQWFLTTEWDRTIRYHTISLWTDNNLGLEQREEDGRTFLENAKKKAGKAWDKVKDTYTNAVAQVDAGVQASKEYWDKLSGKIGMKMSEIEAKVATIITNGIAKGKEKIVKLFSEADKAAAINTFIGGALMCLKNGMNSSDLIDIMSAAGIQ